MISIERLQEFTARCFSQDSFEDPNQCLEITKEMPEYDEYLKNKQKISEIRSKEEHSPLMQACYLEPILTKDQIIHLFRHYNYLKFCIRKKIKNQLIDEEVEKMYAQALEIRNLLATANFRLVGMIKTTIVSSAECDADKQDFVSEIYASVLKSIDYFDWRKGFNFCTYATWSVRNNFYRSRENLRKRKKRTESLKKGGDTIRDRQEGSNHLVNNKIVKKFLEFIDIDRNRMIIEKLFGIDDVENDGRTLLDLGTELGVSKERIRQIKESTIKKIQDKLHDPEVLELLENTIYEKE